MARESKKADKPKEQIVAQNLLLDVEGVTPYVAWSPDLASARRLNAQTGHRPMAAGSSQHAPQTRMQRQSMQLAPDRRQTSVRHGAQAGAVARNAEVFLSFVKSWRFGRARQPCAPEGDQLHN